MGVFAIVALFQDAAIAAADELGWFELLAVRGHTQEELAAGSGITRGPHRVDALIRALISIGALVRDDDVLSLGEVPPRTAVVREGWGLLADVMRSDLPVPLPADPSQYHHHLVRAGADAAREVAPRIAASTVLDLGGGAGAYAAAVLDAQPATTVTLVDLPDILVLARDHLARFGDRVRFVGGDARHAPLGEGHGVALLANVLHLHGPSACVELCAAAARAVAPGGRVVIVEIDADSPEGVWFALDMALYTECGDVHGTRALCGWLAAAGLVEITVERLAAAPETIVVVGRRPCGSGQRFAEYTGLAEPADEVGRELETSLAHTRAGLVLPAPMKLVLSHALVQERRDQRLTHAEDLRRHYTETMPQQREAQRAHPDPLLHAELAWSRLPRLSAAIDRLFDVLAQADVDATPGLGAPTAEAFRGRTPTLAALYERTHYGSTMPLLYGNLADLAYFRTHGGDDPQRAIDRYLTTPIVHELCHLSRARDALQPLHLDECVAGWLGVHVHREFAYPAVGHDDGIFAAPWLSQIGEALVRAFGLRAVVRAHAGAELWDVALPPRFVEAAARLGWDDWRARRTLHFLSDTLDPRPWVALALVTAAGGDPTGMTLAELAATPLSSLALPADPVHDRAIVEDGLRSMCLENLRIEGSFRVRTALPAGLVAIDAAGGSISSARRGEVDVVDPRYWIPPAVGARILAAGHAGYRVKLAALDALPAAATAIAAAVAPGEYPGFALLPWA